MKSKTNVKRFVNELEPIDAHSSEETRMLHSYAEQHGGVILHSVDLSSAYDDVTDKQIIINGLRLDSSLRSDGVYALDSIDDGHQRCLELLENSSPGVSADIIEVCDDQEGAPGFHPFGQVVGKSTLLENKFGINNVGRTVMARCDVGDKYEQNNSDHATRYVYDKHNVSMVYEPAGSNEFVELPDVRVEPHEWNPDHTSLDEKSDATSLKNQNEDRVLKNYYERRGGIKFTEFTVTSKLHDSARVRDADGLIIRTDRTSATSSGQEESGAVFGQKDGNKKFVAKRLRQYPSELIEVHGFGFDGFGQVLGKSTLVEDFWDPANLTRTLITKDTQGAYHSDDPLDLDLIRTTHQFHIQVIDEKELVNQK